MAAPAEVQLRPGKLLIGGRWEEAASGKRFETINPGTGAPLTTVAEAEAADVDRAVAAARRAFEAGPWARMHPAGRGRVLLRIAQLVEAHADELAALDTLDSGKPIAESQRWDLPATIDCLYYYAGWADKIGGETIPVKGPFLTYTLREPAGVVGQIIPWNFPLMMAAWKVAPALATGCTVVLKPAEQTPLSALRLAELCLEAGLPEGVLNVVTGFGETAGEALTRHMDVDKVAFTGSPEVGRAILRAAADSNLKRVSLELGGKSPNIIFADADLRAALRGATRGIFFNQGEVCSAGSRIFVEDSVYDEMSRALIDYSNNLHVGDPLDPKTRMGAIVSEEQFRKVLAYVDVGQTEGATLAAGGHRVGERGYFVAPTVFTDVRNDMRIAREEIFGPVAAVIPFRDAPEAVAQANASAYGLAAAVWTRDIEKAHRVAQRVRAGTVWINSYGQTDTRSPWGGFKSSGFGRELGRAALDLYTDTKSVWVHLPEGDG
jgi:aldehyde dehydrogenase (NAD+)